LEDRCLGGRALQLDVSSGLAQKDPDHAPSRNPTSGIAFGRLWSSNAYCIDPFPVGDVTTMIPAMDWICHWQSGDGMVASTAPAERKLEQLGLERIAQVSSAHARAASYAAPGYAHQVDTVQTESGFVLVSGRLYQTALKGAAHVFDQYQRKGFRCASQLDGAFAALICDADQRKLLLIRDPVGTIPIYYAQAGTACFVATRVLPLLSCPGVQAAPNRSAIAEYFLGGRWFRRGETMYEGISALPPGHFLVIDQRGLQVDRYWDFPVQELRYPAPEMYRAEFRRLLEQAVQRRLGRRTAVFVSGGLDSSALYSAAQTLSNQTAVGITWTATDGSAADETFYIEALERHFDRPILRTPIQPTQQLGAHDRDILYLELPFIGNLPATQARASEIARAAGADVVLDGAWGDQVLAPFPPLYLVTLLRRFRWLTAGRHLRNFLEGRTPAVRTEILSHLGRAAIRLSLPAALLDRRRARLSKQRDAGPFTDDVVGSLSTTERWAEWLPKGLSPHGRSILQTVYHPVHTWYYESTSKTTAQHGIESLQPFLDRDLLGFLACLPPIVHSRNGVPKALLRDSLAGLVPDEVAARRNKGNFTQTFGTGVLRHWSGYAERIVGSTCAFDWGILEPNRVQAKLALIERQRQIDLNQAATELIDLYALVVWLELFFGGESRRQYEQA
jgi:asparagine synthase (glutamine-hydrolysing)